MLIGSFIKTPSGHATEILGDAGFDFVVFDQEHAPFDQVTLDQMLLAARAADTAGIVRVPSAEASTILSVLDCGAVGVLVPHVTSQAMAQEVVAACRYRGGKRGFSNSPRAGSYGRLGIWEHVEANDSQTTVIAMIEDPEAVEAIDEIVAVDGLDAVFIGRGDLTVAFEVESPSAPEIKEATETIAKAAKAADKAVLAMTALGEDGAWLKSLGVSGMIVASDQGFIRQAATAVLKEFDGLRG
jgi:2-keto-3-deoxy-L-rhamnonate aldolase RhmA